MQNFTIKVLSITNRSKNRYTHQDHLLLPITFYSKLKNADIQTHWTDVPSAVEIAQSNVVATREISTLRFFFLNCQTLQIFRGIVFKSYLRRATIFTKKLNSYDWLCRFSLYMLYL